MPKRHLTLTPFVCPDEFETRGIREAGEFVKPEDYLPKPKPPKPDSGYDDWLRPEDQWPGG